MPLSRRQFLARTSVAAAGLPLAAPALRAAVRPARRAEFTPIRRGVGFFSGRGGTIGYLQTPDALVAVDAQFPESAEAFLAGLRDGSARGLDLLVNTHHHGDHTAGNAVLAPVADIHVAHEAVPGLQRAAAVQRGTYDAQRYPSETYARTWSAEVGGEVVALRYLGPAHTCGDSVVHFERADVVHMGDLVFNRRQPFIDAGAGASVAGWIDVLEATHGAFSDDTVFVFGHAGEGYPVTGGRSELLVMRDFLGAAREAVAQALAAGRSAEQIVGAEVPGFEAWGPMPARVVDPIAAELAP
ncbi:MBL fold metallo-hydrolase [Rubrivirga litoralis]|uniref:MBL fold metallo-hydrolase n=1 Tax=Rubrivirga litoralis TaxID=3075598 RepID=A0ABU3BU07_9BACT|nr:MBL fold metallo-hydrolase [Rubrivirga sp. F394]MDT0632774.1 MBL fold metallo-hydrolase [Rubrivirga sp. F394]